jgi:hypothetical protein
MTQDLTTPHWACQRRLTETILGGFPVQPVRRAPRIHVEEHHCRLVGELQERSEQPLKGTPAAQSPTVRRPGRRSHERAGNTGDERVGTQTYGGGEELRMTGGRSSTYTPNQQPQRDVQDWSSCHQNRLSGSAWEPPEGPPKFFSRNFGAGSWDWELGPVPCLSVSPHLVPWPGFIVVWVIHGRFHDDQVHAFLHSLLNMRHHAV